MNTATKTALEDLSTSAKLVYIALEHEGECTQKELAKKTHLVTRTIRNAVTQLEDEDLVDERVSIRDARQRLYSISK